jgi:DNA repair ATPase RecN
MPITLKVKSFQSIKDSEIEIDGFTVITGPNNEGKSALVRSVKGMFSNYTGSQHGWVRNGCDGLSVEMRFSDGGHVLWERGPKHSRYEVNGDCLENAGQYVPDELEELGVKPLKLGRDTKIWPQIADQFSQVFLLNESGAIFAEAIADVDRVGKINKSLRDAESDRKAASSKLKIRRADLKDVEDQLVAMKPLNKAKRCYNKADRARSTALEYQALIRYCDHSRDRFNEIDLEVDELSSVSLIDLVSEEDISNLFDELSNISELVKASEKIKKLDRYIEKTDLSGVDNLLPAVDIDSVNSTIDSLKDLRRIQSELQRLDSTLDKQSDLPDVDLPSDESFRRPVKISNLIKEFSSLQSSIGKSDRMILSLDSEISSSKMDLLGTEDLISETLGGLEFCPTCGKECDEHVG